jgi:hypothetical protein
MVVFMKGIAAKLRGSQLKRPAITTAEASERLACTLGYIEAKGTEAILLTEQKSTAGRMLCCIRLGKRSEH